MDMDLTIWLHNNPYPKKAQAKPHSDAILQQLLQNTLNTSQALTIHKNAQGKPYVKEPIFFSHTNCQNLYAYVLSTTAEVGIDVEYIRPQHDYQKLADRYFCTAEIESLQQRDPTARRRHFYQLWTCKEAWCKMNGGNLWGYLNRSVLAHTKDATTTSADRYIKTTNEILGFACAVACTQPFARIWINHLA